MPEVSVLMSVHNGHPYLRSAIESILKQDYSDFEFIIIDDGSTDGSAQILRSYARTSSRIKLVRQENRGLTPSLNRGLSLVEGKYIARMDADDISVSNRLSVQVAHLDRHPDCVLVGGQVALIDQSGEPVFNSNRPPVHGETGKVEGLWERHASIDKALLDGQWPLVHPAVMMRRDAIMKVGGYDERFDRVQDHDLFLKLAELGTLTNLSKVVLQHRRHEGQVTEQVVDQNYLLRTIRREAYRRRGEALPSDLDLLSIWRSWIGMKLRRTPAWPALLRFYNKMWG